MRRTLASVLLASLAWLTLTGATAVRPPRTDRLGVAPSAALASGSRRDAVWDSLPMRVTLSPEPAHVGERVHYHGEVIVPRGTDVRFGAPEQGGEFTWGDRHAGRQRVLRSFPGIQVDRDSVWVDLDVQVFITGRIAVPGLTLAIAPLPDRVGGGGTRLPTASLLVVPTITSADSNAQLRPLHGPLAAPWWERIPWAWIVAALAALALLTAGIVIWRRRGQKAVAAIAAPRPTVARFDPAAEALAALARLREERLPEAGRFGDHALALTRILRRYLEHTLGTPRPGDTSPELLLRLRGAGLEPADLERLEGLLTLWDRVKFARAPLGIDEARRCELAVEALVKRERRREVA